jgi:hypothetical protein
MIVESKRKRTFLNWRLRLQTSGIYRDPAIPGWKVKTGGTAAEAASAPGWSGPGVSAQVASLQSLTLCSGQNQSSQAIGTSSRL